MKRTLSLAMAAILTTFALGSTQAQIAGDSGAADLEIAAAGKTAAVVVVSPDAGTWEKAAAADLVRCIEAMTGAKPTLADTAEAAAQALAGKAPTLIVGQAALAAEPALAKTLAATAKADPVVNADAIVLRHAGNRVYLAGSNDDSHYYAVAELLRRWGCRWYLPGAIGECLPQHDRLAVGDLDYAYAPPFEVRVYWVAWNGAQEGQNEFRRRNYFNQVNVHSGHALNKYTKDLIPEGGSMYQIPLAEPSTAEHVAKQIEEKFAEGVSSISLGMEDGVYEPQSKRDEELQAGIYDKYFLIPSFTDNFIDFYNRVAGILTEKYPESPTKLGFLAYTNITIPPQQKSNATTNPALIAYLAPIDIDPNHGMDDPRSPPMQEYREIMYRWSEVMDGRVVIYDYDQGMLVWRDIPDPSFATVRSSYQHYLKAGILGIATESRGAFATTFLNLYIRGQLAWNPEADIDALLAEFYPTFYGPAAEPMAAYWGAIFQAWEETPVTEHEYFVIPAIYTQELVETLRGHLEQAEAAYAVEGRAQVPIYGERLAFTRASFNVIDLYTQMSRAGATEGDYVRAAAIGEKGRAAQLELANMNPLFTTRVVNVAAQTEKHGPAWWPGEVKQMRDLAALTDGTQGTLVQTLPLEWAYRRDPRDTGMVMRWATASVDLTHWNSLPDKGSFASHMHDGSHWEMVRTDLYLQAQGVLHPDWHYYNGLGWYRTDVTIDEATAGKSVHLRFPGLFNECWLYVNGYLVKYRPQKHMWWNNSYAFEWDVDLSEHLQPGTNTIALRINNVHHMGGMFRRPFLYEPKAK